MVIGNGSITCNPPVTGDDVHFVSLDKRSHALLTLYNPVDTFSDRVSPRKSLISRDRFALNRRAGRPIINQILDIYVHARA